MHCSIGSILYSLVQARGKIPFNPIVFGKEKWNRGVTFAMKILVLYFPLLNNEDRYSDFLR